MKKVVYLIIMLALTINAFSQSYFMETKPVKVSSYIEKEERIGSVVRPSRERYTTKKSTLSQSIQFIRKNTEFNPKPMVKYYFTAPDSIVREMDIEIDSLNYLERNYKVMTSYKEKARRLNDFDSQYQMIRNDLILFFGLPSEIRPLDLRKNSNGNRYWTREDRWEKDSLFPVGSERTQ